MRRYMLFYSNLDSTSFYYGEQSHDIKYEDYENLIDGLDFLEHVEHKCITDYDGDIGVVFVNKHPTNLGLCHCGLHAGAFMLSGEAWRKLCENKNLDVKVSWANK